MTPSSLLSGELPEKRRVNFDSADETVVGFDFGQAGRRWQGKMIGEQARQRTESTPLPSGTPCPHQAASNSGASCD